MTSPQRIVCLTEETTETLYLMGEEDRIVGISTFTVRPERAAKEKPKVSQFIKADIEKILALEPDLVLAFSDLQGDICAELIKKGLEVYCFNHRSVDGILAMIQTLGRLIDRGDKAHNLTRSFQQNIERARERAATLPHRPRVFFEEWPDPIITGIRWVSELIDIAGGEDCFAEKQSESLAKNRIVTPQEVINRQPDLYLASWCGKRFDLNEAQSREGFENAPFTAPNRVVEIPSSIILQPGPACLTDGLNAIQSEIERIAHLPHTTAP